jgi:translation initiation factor 2B subunit (eIF-2B alpha/beta/delta family)
MKKRIFLASVLSASMLFFSSCNGDDENESETSAPTALSATESKSSIDQVATSLKTDLNTMSENASMDALESFSNVMSNDDDETSMEMRKSVKDYISSVEKALDNSVSVSNARLTDEDDFDLSTSKGVWEWNAEKEEFEEGEANSSLIIKFPSTENGTENDAVFTVNAYKEDANDNPTDVDMSLVKDGSTIFSIDFSATYDSESDPTSMNGKIEMPPYSYEADAKHTSTSLSLGMSINNVNMSIPMASTSMSATFADESLDEPTKINGSLQLYELTLTADVNAKVISDAEEQDSDDMEKIVNDNANVSFTKTSTKQKIGDVVFEEPEENSDEEVGVYVQYEDGSKEDLENMFDETINEIEDFMEEYDLEDDDDSDEN